MFSGEASNIYRRLWIIRMKAWIYGRVPKLTGLGVFHVEPYRGELLPPWIIKDV